MPKQAQENCILSEEESNQLQNSLKISFINTAINRESVLKHLLLDAKFNVMEHIKAKIIKASFIYPYRLYLSYL